MVAGGGDGAGRESASADPVWRDCGNHRFYLREDVLYWECHGPMKLQDITVLFEQRIALQRQHGRVFLLFDAHAMDGIPPESRRYAIQVKPDPPLRGAVAVLGAGLLARAALALLTAAARWLGRGDQNAVFFVDEEAAAWAVIDRERLALRSAAPSL